MSFDFDALHHFEISQDQYNGDSWPDDAWPDELVTLNDVNPADLSHLDPNFDLLWSQINEDGLYSTVGSSELPSLYAPTSLAPPSEASLQPWKPSDIYEIGYQDNNGDWRCNYSGCLSNHVFLRACDLRKHYRSHQKTYFCEEQDCEWSKIGFSSSKDCQRHMRSHRPMIKCSAAESLGCERVFSRIVLIYEDNMVLTGILMGSITDPQKDHYRKIHESSQNNVSRLCRPSTRKKDDVSKSSELDAA
ncbi:hypothetical protein N7517_000691 [Penicillium concentricum]|uniref:C2H2-type domain-containing protein n=1 Tax=Penicillium concentricum TaxID=293559 RepID=A0A9W9VKG7_9EURO|nr:uncharacterized protein N7517_000691 [Penicillium concentricum]KAJ5382780.1 hypothetical protein N7517_000691 [Penicillium concentricum]